MLWILEFKRWITWLNLLHSDLYNMTTFSLQINLRITIVMMIEKCLFHSKWFFSQNNWPGPAKKLHRPNSHEWNIDTFEIYIVLIFSLLLGANISGTFLKPCMSENPTKLQIYTVENGTRVKSVKVTSICRPYYNVEV